MSDIKIPGPQAGLNEIIDAFTMKIIEDRSKENKYNPIRPSAAGECEMKLGYKLMEFKGLAKYETETLPPAVHRLLNLGHQIERHANYEAEAAFKKSPTPIDIKYKQQVLTFFPLADGQLLEGSIDGVIQHADWSMVIDWKSKSDRWSSYYKSSWEEFPEKLCETGHAVKFGEHAIFITDLKKFLEVFDDPWFAKNLYQLNFYACNYFLQDRGINLAGVLQYNKNNSELREIRFVPDKDVYEQVKAKFLRVSDAVVNKKSIEGLNKDYVLGSSACGFCEFKKQCWPENDALKDHFKTLPPKQWAKDLDRLPTEVQAQLVPLFDEYHSAKGHSKNLEKIELDIIKILDKAKVNKIRLNKDQIYQVKRLKEGLVLRRSKA